MQMAAQYEMERNIDFKKKSHSEKLVCDKHVDHNKYNLFEG
jgi:hypothetical protein